MPLFLPLGLEMLTLYHCMTKYAATVWILQVLAAKRSPNLKGEFGLVNSLGILTVKDYGDFGS